MIHSSDLFYKPGEGDFDVMESMGVLAVEMEAAGIYGLAAQYGARALAIVTVSDLVRNGGALSPEERQSSLGDMVEITLDALKRDLG